MQTKWNLKGKKNHFNFRKCEHSSAAMTPFQLSFYSLFSSGRSEFPSSGDLKPLSRQACFLHAQQIMLNFSPEPNLPWVLMYYFMFTILKTAAHSNAKEPPIKRQRHQRFYWVSPKCFTSRLFREWYRFVVRIYRLTSILDSDQWVSFAVLQKLEGCKKILSLVCTMLHVDQRNLTVGLAVLIFFTYVCKCFTWLQCICKSGCKLFIWFTLQWFHLAMLCLLVLLNRLLSKNNPF